MRIGLNYSMRGVLIKPGGAKYKMLIGASLSRE